jgi:hypothetical protein
LSHREIDVAQHMELAKPFVDLVKRDDGFSHEKLSAYFSS